MSYTPNFFEGWMASFINTRSQMWAEVDRERYGSESAKAIYDQIDNLQKNIQELEKRKLDLTRAMAEGKTGIAKELIKEAASETKRATNRQSKEARDRQKVVDGDLKALQSRQTAIRKNGEESWQEARKYVKRADQKLTQSWDNKDGRGDFTTWSLDQWRIWWDESFAGRGTGEESAGLSYSSLGIAMKPGSTLPNEGAGAGVFIEYYEHLLANYSDPGSEFANAVANGFFMGLAPRDKNGDLIYKNMEEYKKAYLWDVEIDSLRSDAEASANATPIEREMSGQSTTTRTGIDADDIRKQTDTIYYGIHGKRGETEIDLAIADADLSITEKKAKLKELESQLGGLGSDDRASTFGRGWGWSSILEPPYVTYFGKTEEEIAVNKMLISISNDPAKLAQLRAKLREYSSVEEAAQDVGEQVLVKGPDAVVEEIVQEDPVAKQEAEIAAATGQTQEAIAGEEPAETRQPVTEEQLRDARERAGLSPVEAVADGVDEALAQEDSEWLMENVGTEESVNDQLSQVRKTIDDLEQQMDEALAAGDDETAAKLAEGLKNVQNLEENLVALASGFEENPDKSPEEVVLGIGTDAPQFIESARAATTAIAENTTDPIEQDEVLSRLEAMPQTVGRLGRFSPPGQDPDRPVIDALSQGEMLAGSVPEMEGTDLLANYVSATTPPPKRPGASPSEDPGRRVLPGPMPFLMSKQVSDWVAEAKEALKDGKLQLNEVDLIVDLDDLGPSALKELLHPDNQEGNNVFFDLQSMAYDQGMHDEETNERLQEVLAALPNVPGGVREAGLAPMESTPEQAGPSVGTRVARWHGGAPPDTTPPTLEEEKAEAARASQYSLQHVWNIYRAMRKEEEGGGDQDYISATRDALVKALAMVTPEDKEYLGYDPEGQEVFKEMLTSLARNPGAEGVARHAAQLRALDDRRTVQDSFGPDVTPEQLQAGLDQARELQMKYQSDFDVGKRVGENIGRADQRLVQARMDAERYGNYADMFERQLGLISQ